jgi:hypothetical protein
MAKLRRRGAEARVVRMGIGSLREAERLARAWAAEEEDGRRRREGRLRLETV